MRCPVELVEVDLRIWADFLISALMRLSSRIASDDLDGVHSIISCHYAIPLALRGHIAKPNFTISHRMRGQVLYIALSIIMRLFHLDKKFHIPTHLRHISLDQSDPSRL